MSFHKRMQNQNNPKALGASVAGPSQKQSLGQASGPKR